MRLYYLTIISFISGILGMLLLAYQQEWIIIRKPWSSSTEYQMTGVSKQKITLYYSANHAQETSQNIDGSVEGYKKHSQELIISDDTEKKATAIIAAWLTDLHDENIIRKRVILQSAMLNPSKTQLYVSFDQTLFDQQQSTLSKWTLLQCLIKTLKENGIPLSGIYFLVNHRIMEDDQLDFSNAWTVK